MPDYEKELAKAKASLVIAEQEYSEAVSTLGNAIPGVREYILMIKQTQIDQSKFNIEMFTLALKNPNRYPKYPD